MNYEAPPPARLNFSTERQKVSLFTEQAQEKSAVPNIPLSNPMSGTSGAGQILKGGIVYTLVSLLQRSLSFLLLPFYARVLSPAEFGQIAIITTVTALTSTALSFGIESAVFRQFFALKHDETTRRTFLSTVGTFALVVPTLITLVLAAMSVIFVSSGSTLDRFALGIGFLAAGSMVFGSVIVLPLLRVERRLGPFVAFSSLSIFSTVILTMIFVVGFKWVPSGWFLAQLVGALIALPYGLKIFKPHWTPRLDGVVLKEALRFGTPLVPHQVAHWSLSIADRAILSFFVSPALVGIYSMGYQITSVMGNVLTSANQTLMPEYASMVGRNNQSNGLLRRSATFQLVFSAFLAVGASLVLPPVMRLILPPEYGAAAELVPWIALGYFFFGAYYVPMNMLTLVNGDTKWNWVFTVLAGAIASGLNFFLIPVWGIKAAAIITACGYAFLFTLLSVYGHLKHGNVWPIDGRVARTRLLPLSAITIIGLVFRPDSLPVALIVAVVLAILSAAVAATTLLPLSAVSVLYLSMGRRLRKPSI